VGAGLARVGAGALAAAALSLLAVAGPQLVDSRLSGPFLLLLAAAAAVAAVELRLVRLAGVPAVAALLVGAEEPLAPSGQPWLGRRWLDRRQPARSAPGLWRRYW